MSGAPVSGEDPLHIAIIKNYISACSTRDEAEERMANMPALIDRVASNLDDFKSLQTDIQLLYLTMHLRANRATPINLWRETDPKCPLTTHYLQENLLPRIADKIHSKDGHLSTLNNLLKQCLEYAPHIGRLLFQAGVPLKGLKLTDLLHEFCNALSKACAEGNESQLDFLRKAMVGMIFEAIEDEDLIGAEAIMNCIQETLQKMDTSKAEGLLTDLKMMNKALNDKPTVTAISAGLVVQKATDLSDRETDRARLMKRLFTVATTTVDDEFVAIKASTFLVLRLQTGTLHIDGSTPFSKRGQELARAIIPLSRRHFFETEPTSRLVNAINCALPKDEEKIEPTWAEALPVEPDNAPSSTKHRRSTVWCEAKVDLQKKTGAEEKIWFVNPLIGHGS